MPLDLIVFDMAGTTVDDSDNAVASCVCRALGKAGVGVGLREVDPVMGMPKPLAIRELLREARHQEPSNTEVNDIHADFQRRMVQHYLTSPDVQEIPGAAKLFLELRARGVRVALDTGFDRRILDAILTRLGWGPDLLDATVASDEVAHGRPHPDMIHHLMHKLGVTDSAHVGKIGDSVSDIEEGLNARCGFVGAILNERTTPFMHRFPAVAGLRNLGDLIPALEGARAREYAH